MARILIAGASLGGLFAANMLWRDGHDVQVFEKVRSSMSGRGAGIVTHDALTLALQRAGAGPGLQLGVEVPGRVLLNRDGSTHSRLNMPQVLTSWSRLYDLLQCALPVERCHSGVTVSEVFQHADGVQLMAQVDGTAHTWQGDLLVACDGLRSAVRQQLWPQVQPRYAGYVAWRGVCEEALLSRHTQETLFPYFGFCVPPHEQIIGYPVAGGSLQTTPGQRAYNFVWYRPADENTELVSLMSDADGQHHPQGLAPHIGMGVTKAAEDAVALADAVRAHGASTAALAAYAAAVKPRGLAAVARARWLGAQLEASHASTLPNQAPPPDRQHQAITETAIDLGRYGHRSAFQETSTP